MIYLANVSEARMLGLIFGLVAQESLVARLYSDNHVDNAADTAASFLEMDGHGYVPIIIPPSAWTITPGDPSVAEAPEVQWPFPTGGPAVPVYGVFFTWQTSGILAFQERLGGGPFMASSAGDMLAYTPRVTLRPET